MQATIADVSRRIRSMTEESANNESSQMLGFLSSSVGALQPTDFELKHYGGRAAL